MTICVSISIAEGLVLAADSAVTLQGQFNTPQGQQNGVLQQFNYANKLTRFKDYPIGVMSWGAASISDRSIQSLIMEFEHSYVSVKDRALLDPAEEAFTVRGVADDLLVFMKDRYDAAYSGANPLPSLGMLVGGFSQDQFFSDSYSCDLSKTPSDWEQVRPRQVDGRPSFGANWFGQTGPLTRLIQGFDAPSLAQLVVRGADKALIQTWIDDSVSEMPLVFDAMPLQDAIDLADFLTQVVIGTFRFGTGPQLCGGDVDIAVITPTNFRWSKRKQWAITEEKWSET